MPYSLPEDRMPEAEVSLRLAFHLLAMPNSHRNATVGIDGAQIRVHGAAVFPIAEFLDHKGWNLAEQQGRNPWQGVYRHGDWTLIVTSQSGIRDVVAEIGEGKRLRDISDLPLDLAT